MADEVIEQTDSELLNDATDELEEPLAPEDETNEDKEPKEDKDDKEDKKLDDEKSFPYERTSIAEIKAEYPEIFKKFPNLRDSIFRDVEYTKMFPSIEDAKEAVEDNLAFVGLRDSVLNGKAEDLLGAVKEADPKSLEKLALNFLPTIYSKHNELYSTVVTPLFESLVRNLYRSSDENTRNAALVVANYLFQENGERVAEGKASFAKSTAETPDEKKLREERENYQTEQYTGFRNNVLSDLGSERAKLISRGLDPDGSMTNTQKEMLIERIANKVDVALASDAAHMSIMNARWLRSRREGYNTASKEKIISAYLSRAKQVIPSIRDKERDEFFGTRKKASQSKLEQIDSKSSKTKEITSGRSSGSSGREVLKPGRDLYRKMSDIEILNTN